MVIKSIMQKAPSVSKYCDIALNKVKYSKIRDEYFFSLENFKKIP